MKKKDITHERNWPNFFEFIGGSVEAIESKDELINEVTKAMRLWLMINLSDSELNKIAPLTENICKCDFSDEIDFCDPCFDVKCNCKGMGWNGRCGQCSICGKGVCTIKHMRKKIKGKTRDGISRFDEESKNIWTGEKHWDHEAKFFAKNISIKTQLKNTANRLLHEIEKLK